jgi:hypothetical protein
MGPCDGGLEVEVAVVAGEGGVWHVGQRVEDRIERLVAATGDAASDVDGAARVWVEAVGLFPGDLIVVDAAEAEFVGGRFVELGLAEFGGLHADQGGSDAARAEEVSAAVVPAEVGDRAVGGADVEAEVDGLE